MDRRSFLRAGLTTMGVAGMASINPGFFISSAFASQQKTMVFLSAENITGNWDPTAHTTLSQSTIEGFVMGFLIRSPMRPDNPEQIVYDLATSYEEIDSYKIKFNLRKGVKFHDGRPFTSEDIKATFKYASRLDRPRQSFPGGPDTFDVETPDEHTVIFNTEKGGYGAGLFLFLASYIPIMSAADVALGAGGPLTQRLNGTGPFTFGEQKGNTTKLLANANYYAGAPKVPGVDYTFTGDATTRMLSLMSGEADVIERLEPEQVDTLSAKDDIKISTVLSVENKYLFFRCSKPPFNDWRVRRAACHAIDRSMILELLGDAGSKSKNFVSPIKFGYTDLDNYPEYDPEECQRLLAEAGYPKGEGLPKLEYLTSTGFYPKTKEYGELITALLQEQGFPVELNVMEVAAWNERLYDRPGGGPGHMVDCGWAPGSPEPDLVLRAHFHSSSKRICGIEDPELDAALDEERDAPSLAERKKSLQTNLMPMLADKAPALSLFTSVMIHAMRKDVDGLFFYPDGLMNAKDTTIS
ncbi:peptide/nickel transport system substrate-binding protein [Vibrio xiamenensis]|uniref:Peptide/nickel transport system substrate-binding protein n=1 Tax=Vibrio xiamenensis TaxID=861298 RepID=A0A1G8HD67_9VIBR|nr:ABC transporter substrate-binding protein [Vibrio xiamenensis]SDI04505.1 peptide/nickel transport system substrate-binding protein [Vibrio xiamenensis]